MTDAVQRKVGIKLADRCRLLLPAVWAGWLLCTALAAAPSAFSLLPPVDAGRVASRLLALEAYVSLATGVLLLLLERGEQRRAAARSGASQFNVGTGLALASLFCTVAGYFGVLPLMTDARAGHGALSFGQLHGISAAFFLCKLAVVLSLAWRAAGATASSSPRRGEIAPQRPQAVSRPPSSSS